jgi:hypothetical protein
MAAMPSGRCLPVRAPQDAIDVGSRPPKLTEEFGGAPSDVAQQASLLGKVGARADRRQVLADRQTEDQVCASG